MDNRAELIFKAVFLVKRIKKGEKKDLLKSKKQREKNRKEEFRRAMLKAGVYLQGKERKRIEEKVDEIFIELYEKTKNKNRAQVTKVLKSMK